MNLVGRHFFHRNQRCVEDDVACMLSASPRLLERFNYGLSLNNPSQASLSSPGDKDSVGHQT